MIVALSRHFPLSQRARLLIDCYLELTSFFHKLGVICVETLSFCYFSLCGAVVDLLFEILLDAVGSAVEAFVLFIILLKILFDIVSFVGLLRVSLQLVSVYKSFFCISYLCLRLFIENRPTVLFRPIIQIVRLYYFVRPDYYVRFRPIRLIFVYLIYPSNLVRLISHCFYILIQI